MRQGLDIRIDTISEAHSFTQLARIDLADVIRSRGRLGDARATFNEAIANLENNGDAGHPHVAQALTGLAQISIVEGNPREAIALLERSIAMTEASIGRDHLDNVNRRLLLAEALQLSGDTEQAAAVRVPAEARRAEIMADWNQAIAEDSLAP